jgi:hypothetical protein
MAGAEWQKPGVKNLKKFLVKGTNVIAIEATNDPSGDPAKPEGPAGMWALISVRVPGEGGKGTKVIEVGTDGTWDVTKEKPGKGWMKEGYALSASWTKAADLVGAEEKYDLVPHLAATNKPYTLREGKYRAVWAKNDRLMTALGRPDREQTVTYRMGAATTLQMLELTNGPELYDMLKAGARRWMSEPAASDRARVEDIYMTALGRGPTEQEWAVSQRILSEGAKEEGVEDLLWSVVMLPEFQLVY